MAAGETLRRRDILDKHMIHVQYGRLQMEPGLFHVTQHGEQFKIYELLIHAISH